MRLVLITAFCMAVSACGSVMTPATPPHGIAGATSVSTSVPDSPPTSGPDGLLPSLERAAIYSGTTPDLQGYDPAHIRVLVVTGDVVPARITNYRLHASGRYQDAWTAMSPILRGGDITLINLGAPLLGTCPVGTTGSRFCGDAGNIQPMLAAGTNPVVNLANNHIDNYGLPGRAETQQRLAAAGAAVSGFDDIAVRSVRGLRFAFVGLDFVSHRPTHDDLRQRIAAARSEADVVVAQIHAGKEYETFPMASPGLAPEDPKALDKLAIDDGADMVVGNFPHCVQGSEVYKGHLIAYAHGNFLFDQDWSNGTQEGVVGTYYFNDTHLVAVRYVPLHIVKQVTPTPLDPATGEGRSILDRMSRSSKEIAGLQPPHRPDLTDGQSACT